MAPAPCAASRVPSTDLASTTNTQQAPAERSPRTTPPIAAASFQAGTTAASRCSAIRSVHPAGAAAAAALGWVVGRVGAPERLVPGAVPYLSHRLLEDVPRTTPS